MIKLPFPYRKKRLPESLKDFYVSQPCNQDWEDMELTGDGRFCKVCCKEVFDFRHISKEKLQEIYQRQNGKICGLSYADQLGEKTEKSGFIHQLVNKSYWLLTILLLRFSTLALGVGGDGSVKKSSQTVGHSLHIQFKEKEEKHTSKNAKVYGVIREKDDTSKAVSNAYITLMNAHGDEIFSTKTDKNGTYEILLPDTFNLANTYYLKVEKENWSFGKYRHVYKNQTVILQFDKAEKKVDAEIKYKAKKKFRLRLHVRKQTMGYYHHKSWK